MNQFICYILIFINSSLLAAYGQFHFKGIYPLWETASTAAERLEIMNYFLPENPTVFEAGVFDGHESIQFAAFWPKEESFLLSRIQDSS
ncbi:MAG: hypothetical protein K1X28_06800 [Parachlamydiales bacterium]|nr:hypothetical protein [Parachlamydiales bacterium]